MLLFRDGDRVIVDLTRPGTIVGDVLVGARRAAVAFDGGGVDDDVAPERIRHAAPSDANPALDDAVFVRDHAHGFVWRGAIVAVDGDRATVRLDGLDGQTIIAPVARVSRVHRNRGERPE